MTPMEIAAPGVVVFALIIGIPSVWAWVSLQRQKKVRG
jgi:hypothetical protein